MISNPEIVNELSRIAEEHNGILMPEVVVEEARNEKSPLHSRFEWDNTKAAHDYRLWQARQLISVTVIYTGGKRDTTPVPVFVSLTPDRHNGGGYRPLASVLSDKEQRKQLLDDACSDMRVFQNKYQMLSELAGVRRAMSRTEQKLSKK